MYNGGENRNRYSFVNGSQLRKGQGRVQSDTQVTNSSMKGKVWKTTIPNDANELSITPFTMQNYVAELLIANHQALVCAIGYDAVSVSKCLMRIQYLHSHTVARNTVAANAASKTLLFSSLC